jgi:hypothetical protein
MRRNAAPTGATRSRWARRVAVAVAAGRSALGVVAIVAPSLPLTPWVGSDHGDDARLLARALGGRDLALGAGALAALAGDGPSTAWVAMGGLADLVDASATLRHWRRLPSPGRVAVLAAAGGGVAASLVACLGAGTGARAEALSEQPRRVAQPCRRCR